ncbi:hypothetical protein RvY_01616 [Ramazzottius varieornatus]|uniref:Uncharacterized protein n=1 Tax=Ramazzottius varieornatus TaxID=947166 RepID=A0A1D1UP16_RAMVA|nr:hypothetical protein RvY_01616 [Ramazzottius varieornatus]
MREDQTPLVREVLFTVSDHIIDRSIGNSNERYCRGIQGVPVEALIDLLHHAVKEVSFRHRDSLIWDE